MHKALSTHTYLVPSGRADAEADAGNARDGGTVGGAAPPTPAQGHRVTVFGHCAEEQERSP